jgi:hypothetical protein
MQNYSIPDANWSPAAIISQDVSAAFLTVSAFKNVCSITLINSNMNIITWTQVMHTCYIKNDYS